MSLTTIIDLGHGRTLELGLNDLGVQNGSAYFSEKAVEKIVIRAQMDAFPEHVQYQIRERRTAVRDVILHFMERAINNDRYLLVQELQARGMHDAASYIATEKVTR